MMLAIRSFLFNLFYVFWSAVTSLLAVPAYVMPYRYAHYSQILWCRGLQWVLKHLTGIRVDIRGRENILQEPAIYASKHQSAWETSIFQLLLHKPSFLMKQELMRIPFVGWYSRKLRMIPVDRARGNRAIRSVLRAGRKTLAEGRSIIIFPEGTRVDPWGHRKRRYQPGVFALYKGLNCPVVPVAVNSGLHWPRDDWRRPPGTITMEFLDPIEPGLDRGEFMDTLRRRIEQASDRLRDAELAAMRENGVPVKGHEE